MGNCGQEKVVFAFVFKGETAARLYGSGDDAEERGLGAGCGPGKANGTQSVRQPRRSPDGDQQPAPAAAGVQRQRGGLWNALLILSVLSVE